MTGPQQPKKPPAWQVGWATVVSFVGLLYLIEVFDRLADDRLEHHGIRPLEAKGLWGILFAPLLHADWPHLLSNTVPLLVLGFLMTLTGLSRFFVATALVWLVGGFGTWLIGNLGACPHQSDHIGASGLIFGWLAFLVVFGVFVRRVRDIIIGLVVMFAYGGLVFAAVPVLNRCQGMSWQGHLCGAIAGVLAAFLLSGPERRARAREQPRT
jgi:membrane associated rhomboid family serine protease